MSRRFKVKAHVAPHLPKPLDEEISGGFSFGAYDAVKEYADKHLPGYAVIPGGVRFDLVSMRFSAIDHHAGLGAVIYVEELQ